MSKDHIENPEDYSDIPEVKLPEEGFKSEIPEALLQDCSAKDRYLYESLSEMKGYIKWSAPIVLDSNRQVRKTNGRVNQNEKDIDNLEEQIKSWINFKNWVFKTVKNKYFIMGMAVIIFLCLYPFAIYVSKIGGVLAVAQSIIKAIWS